MSAMFIAWARRWSKPSMENFGLIAYESEVDGGGRTWR